MARVFLSHAHADKPAVRRIRDELRAAGHHPWFDEDDIRVGDSILARIEEGMREADYVVVCLSAAAATSPWAQAERNSSVIAQRMSGRARILPVRLEDVPPPPMLAHIQSVDLFPDDQFMYGITVLVSAMMSRADEKALGDTLTMIARKGGADRKGDGPRLANARAAELRQAYERKRRLEGAGGAGAPVDDVVAEILALKRELRHGGQLRPGDALGDGRYVLLKKIGRGGFAAVWEAQDQRYGDQVAVKVLHGELRGDPVRRDRFFRGVRAMAGIPHDGVVRVRDLGGEDDGYWFFVMELITGGDLRERVVKKLFPSDDTPLSEAIVKVARGVASALVAAHARGLVHRDVKPANILLTELDHPRLTDFDLVAAKDTTGGTRTGALGTFVYAAPEMLDRPQDADARADVYSLGMTIAFMLHGRELPTKVIRDPQRFVRGLECEPEFKRVVQRAVAWEPEARFADIASFAQALREADAPPTIMVEDRWKPKTLRDLLKDIRKGYTLYRPILIEIEQGTRVAPDAPSDSTISLYKPLRWADRWAEQYGREYVNHPYLVLGPNKLTGGVETPVTVGRSRRCDVRVDNDSVSKVHASVVFDRASGEYYVVDENSRNGTYINGAHLTPGVPAPVWSGAYVSFGDAVFVFVDPVTLRKLGKLAM